MKVAFIDRDGTIIKDYEDNAWFSVANPEFLDGAIEGLQKILVKGYKIIIVTNQYIIGENIISLSQYYNFTEKFLKFLTINNIAITDIFFCPHSRKVDCPCRKPKTGLIDLALQKYPLIDLEHSLLVGDSITDMILAENLGIKSFGINVKGNGLTSIEVRSLLDVLKYL